MGRVIILTALLASLGSGITGCGYSTESLHRTSVNTVYIDMFASREFRRGIEFQLTEALRKEIDRSTPYKNAPRQKADTIISGRVLEWRQTAFARDPRTDRDNEVAATLAVSFRWQDMRTGKILVEKPQLVTTVQYVRATGEDVYNARDMAASQMARRIVEQMETPW